MKYQKITKHHRVKSRPSYSYDFCGHHIHPTANTIFHKSPTSLRTWFFVIYQTAQTRSGVSAKQIEHMTGVTYKCAWRMIKQICTIMENDDGLLMGSVQIGKTFFQARSRLDCRLPRSKNPDRRNIVMGMVEQGSRFVARHVDNVGAKTLIDRI